MITETYRSPVFILEGYRAFTVKFSNGSKKTILEHREIMEKKLGRQLKKGEVVHHIDENKQNNNNDNLKLETNSQHSKHHNYKGGPKYITLICSYCKKSFERLERYEKHNRKQNKSGPFCSKVCNGKVNN